ncbi:nuclear transport factor 2 family protein [Hymenobacter oligotrophus]|uniref:Nuclear transport factor 2 family protein n=1 Tax=Hymenobacter oligotrophus TaxID=2319843 RepID=A0A3B7RQF5_9BACT|nr:nuclear transport factor 2 family protein [Hymenobacter oligotrophus]AYA36417.1 nuclear transport factor 2 family protein [Hymenobacter oligotrophus]
MRTLLLLALGALCGLYLQACTAARPVTPSAQSFAPDEQQIRAVLSTQTAAWNRADLAAFMQGYWQSDSLLFIGKNGPTRGWQRTLDNYRRNYPDAAAMGQLTFSQLQVRPISADAAHVVGRWQLARPAAGDVSGWFTLLFRRLNGQWVIVADHSS